MAPFTPVPPPSWPISPGGAGSPGPALRFALMFLYPRVGKFVSCLLCVPPAPIFKAIEKVYAIKAVVSFLSGPRPFIQQPVGGIGLWALLPYGPKPRPAHGLQPA